MVPPLWEGTLLLFNPWTHGFFTSLYYNKQPYCNCLVAKAALATELETLVLYTYNIFWDLISSVMVMARVRIGFIIRINTMLGLGLRLLLSIIL